MLPNAQHTPSGGRQRLVNQPVAGSVTSQFQTPKVAVGSRYGAMLRAAVPEAAIHKYRQTELRKNEIRAAEQRHLPAPTDQVIFSQEQIGRASCRERCGYRRS